MNYKQEELGKDISDKCILDKSKTNNPVESGPDENINNEDKTDSSISDKAKKNVNDENNPDKHDFTPDKNIKDNISNYDDADKHFTGVNIPLDEVITFENNVVPSNSLNDNIFNQRNELEDLLAKINLYIKPALREVETFDYRIDDKIINYSYKIDDRRIDQFIAGCFIHIKLTTVYFDELADLVFGCNEILKKDKSMLLHLNFINNYYLRFFEKKDKELIRRILNVNNPISTLICWIVVDNYSDKYNDLANKIINDYPTESRILEDEVVPGIHLNVVQVMINKVVRFMSNITEI